MPIKKQDRLMDSVASSNIPRSQFGSSPHLVAASRCVHRVHQC
jgi:hypothetical protein